MIIRLAHTWRPSPGVLLHPGDYWAPRDIPVELAQRAIDEVVATLIPEKPAPLEHKVDGKGKPAKATP